VLPVGNISQLLWDTEEYEMAIMEETQPKDKVSRAARKAYEQSVFDNRCDEQVLFQARRIRPEWERDRTTYQARVRACEVLKCEVPRLEASAAEAARAAADAEAFARSPLADGSTIGELRQRVLAVDPQRRVGTPAELAQGLLFLVGSMPDGAVGRLKSKALAARAAVADTAAQAQRLLRLSAATVAPDGEVAKLGSRINQLQQQIAGRREVLEAEGKLPATRAECESLAAGNRPPDFASYHAPGQKRIPLAMLYREARHKLDRLCELLARKPDAERDNARDLEELAQLKEKLQAAQQAALVRLGDARDMKWVGDE
jgi:hypothetical protein